LIRNRLVYLGFAATVIAIGLASRRYRASLPLFLGDYSGDTLWALMVYLLVSVLMPAKSISIRAIASLVIAFSVETSQLYHAPWIDGIRQTTLGGLVLGFGFLWTDLICYTVGIILGAVTEFGINACKNSSATKP
jgi:hypothetical protein